MFPLHSHPQGSQGRSTFWCHIKAHIFLIITQKFHIHYTLEVKIECVVLFCFVLFCFALRFSCLYDLKVSGPEIRHLPANHPSTQSVFALSILTTSRRYFEHCSTIRNNCHILLNTKLQAENVGCTFQVSLINTKVHKGGSTWTHHFVFLASWFFFFLIFVIA